MVTYTNIERTLLSNREFVSRHRWSALHLPFFNRQKGLVFLTPFGWFSVLAFGAIATGAALGFSL